MDAPDVSAVIKQYDLILVQNYCILSSNILFLYDWLVTLGDEVTFFWCRRKTGASIIYFLNRYVFLIGSCLLGIVSGAGFSNESCERISKANQALAISIFAVWAAFSALRALALSQSRPLGFLVLILSLLPFGVNLALYHFGISGAIQPGIGCVVVVQSLTPETSTIFTIISRSSLIASDTLLILVTWKALYARNNSFLTSGGLSFVDVILRDGTVYFVAMLVVNVLHLVLSLLSDASNEADPGISLVTVFTQPITCCLVSRFLADLQSVEHATVEIGARSAQPVGSQWANAPSLVFARAVESFASSIEYRDEHQVRDEGEDRSAGYDVSVEADGEDGIEAM